MDTTDVLLAGVLLVLFGGFSLLSGDAPLDADSAGLLMSAGLVLPGLYVLATGVGRRPDGRNQETREEDGNRGRE